MFIIIVWTFFIFIMSLGVLEHKIDTFLYLLYGFTILYFIYVYRLLN